MSDATLNGHLMVRRNCPNCDSPRNVVWCNAWPKFCSDCGLRLYLSDPAVEAVEAVFDKRFVRISVNDGPTSMPMTWFTPELISEVIAAVDEARGIKGRQ